MIWKGLVQDLREVKYADYNSTLTLTFGVWFQDVTLLNLRHDF